MSVGIDTIGCFLGSSPEDTDSARSLSVADWFKLAPIPVSQFGGEIIRSMDPPLTPLKALSRDKSGDGLTKNSRYYPSCSPSVLCR